MLGRVLTSRLFPLLAAAIGALIGAAAFALSADGVAAATLGLATAAIVLAARNWWVAEDERPLLAEELIGVHEAVDGLRDDSDDLRAMLVELTGIVEDVLVDPDAVAAREVDRATLTLIGARLEALERRAELLEAAPMDAAEATPADAEADKAETPEAETPKAETPETEAGATDAAAVETAEAAAARDALTAIQRRLDAHDARTGKILRALSMAVAEARDNDARLKRLEDIDAAAASVDATTETSASASEPAATVAPSATKTRETEIRQTAAETTAEMASAPAAAPETPPPSTERQAAGSRRSWRQRPSGTPRSTPQSTARDIAAATAPKPAKQTRSSANGRAPSPSTVANGVAPRPTVEPARRRDQHATVAPNGHNDARFELYLQPVLRLADRKPAYFEALPDRNGSARSGPEADDILFVRSIGVVDELRRKSSSAGVFCNVSIETLRSRTFLDSFLAYLETKRPIADLLTLEFSQQELQADLGAMTERDAAVLARIREAGFRFSLDQVSDWTVDIHRLSSLGFQFVKVGAADLIAKLDAGGGSAEPLMTAFGELGLELVVEQIEDADEAERIVAAGVRYGQGRALAEPRLIRLN